MNSRPNQNIAALLGFFIAPLGFLYVARLWQAVVYIILALGVTGTYIYYLHHPPYWDAILVLCSAFVCSTYIYRLAKHYPDDKPRPHYSRWYGLLGCALGYALIALLIRSFGLEPYHIPSGSMQPTLPVGSYIVTSKWGYGHYGSYGITLARRPLSQSPNRGDIVVYERPSTPDLRFVSRIIGLPGDRISYRDYTLTLNGQTVALEDKGTLAVDWSQAFSHKLEKLPGQYHDIQFSSEIPTVQTTLSAATVQGCTIANNGIDCTIPSGNYFVMGDNRSQSADSRIWGFLPADNIVAKVIHIIP
ncbi:signal peptidase I [Uliginosibacterium gangwonense]|uniref:signal peptidase I n=1 Tax=Uliginosibacterium gangwonense TaxID=392736 RepID=UPI00035FA63C|nr:signal peptidase I [Uliginosibacterium gangwonense]